MPNEYFYRKNQNAVHEALLLNLNDSDLENLKFDESNWFDFVYKKSNSEFWEEVDCDECFNYDEAIANILLTKSKNKIQVSGRLFKSGALSHDPNIGALSIICAVLRKLGWEEKIEITQHGLEQKHVGTSNKFIQIANKLDISLQSLTISKAVMNVNYWKYDTNGEKLGTIFIHLVVENQ